MWQFLTQQQKCNYQTLCTIPDIIFEHQFLFLAALCKIKYWAKKLKVCALGTL